MTKILSDLSSAVAQDDSRTTQNDSGAEEQLPVMVTATLLMHYNNIIARYNLHVSSIDKCPALPASESHPLYQPLFQVFPGHRRDH